MKKFITLSLWFLFAIATMVNAQNNEKRRFSPERYKARMEEFITKEAELTKEDGEKFFPMLHEMMDKQRQVNRESHKLMHQGKNAASEEDYKRIINELTDLDIKNKQIEKEYYNKFNSALSWQKILKVRNALFRFNMEALQRFSPASPNDGNRPNRGNRPERGNNTQRN